MEDLDRGLVAVQVSGGNYVGWRMLGYEYNATDPANVAYNLYRDGNRIATVTDSTNFLDSSGTATSSYSASLVIGGLECARSAAVTPWAQNYLSVPITAPPTGPLGGVYAANDAAPGDLDGDGQLDLVLKWDPSYMTDLAITQTDSVLIDGLKLDGTRLWRIDVGKNIAASPHETQMSVYDFDGDGKAELAIKTAPGTKDGLGNYLKTGPAAGADNTIDYRQGRMSALGGPEWLTVFDGATGAERATVEYPVPYSSTTWGDTSGSRSQRFNGGFAFVKDDGVATGRPSIIQQRGFYTRLTVSALTYRNGLLAKNWVFDSDTLGNAKAAGQGTHSLMAADVDNDGAQELIPGASTINSDGTFRCSTAMGHGDAMHVGELVPGKGITVFTVHESLGGHDAHDAATCAFYFNVSQPGTDNGRGVADYVGPGDEDSASCSSSAGSVHCADGSMGAPSAGSNFLVYWDADEWRELEDGNTITKSGGAALLTATGCSGNNGSKNTPTLTADLFGDWREELVLRQTDGKALRVYTTTDVTARRVYTLMHDPTYRAQVNFEQSGYNQPPHTGFRISPNMAPPPKPDIFVVPRVK
jgi:hypothetical protein